MTCIAGITERGPVVHGPGFKFTNKKYHVRDCEDMFDKPEIKEFFKSQKKFRIDKQKELVRSSRGVPRLSLAAGRQSFGM